MAAGPHPWGLCDILGDSKVVAARAALLRCLQLQGVLMHVSLHEGGGVCLLGVVHMLEGERHIRTPNLLLRKELQCLNFRHTVAEEVSCKAVEAIALCF